jgi:hypothetical protein
MQWHHLRQDHTPCQKPLALKRGFLEGGANFAKQAYFLGLIVIRLGLM